MTDTFDTLRPQLETYLREQGIDPRKRFRCLNPDHPDRHPAMGYDPKRHKVHCFACGADYDLFDLLMLDEHLASPREALAVASKRYGNGSAVPAVPSHRESGEEQWRGHSRTTGEALSPSEEDSENFSDKESYIQICAENRNKIDYFASRGISEATAARFLLGYDPEADCVVLPCDEGHIVRRSVSEKRYLNEKGIPSPLFQAAFLKPQADTPFEKFSAPAGGISDLPDSGKEQWGGHSLLKREPPPPPPGRETRGDFDFPPHPLETTQRGGLRSPSLETPSSGADDGTPDQTPERGNPRGAGAAAPAPLVPRGGMGDGGVPHVSGGGQRGRVLFAKAPFPLSEGRESLFEKNGPPTVPSRTSGEVVEICFIVEGVFDALSAEELGFHACAMNGSGNRTKIAALLRDLPDTAPVLLLPDNDRAGDEWATALQNEFPWLYRCPPLPKGKDLNELLCADRALAEKYLQSCAEAWQAQLPPAYETTSAAGQLDAFAAYIAAQAARPPLQTGFPKLDAALDGGLYDGLYVIGAVSSLGKTAFCMQMADQLAQQGRDVLIFSLEMTAFELMARSVSRETFRNDTSARRRMAKTVRGVLDGRRYPDYSPEETAHLQAATAAYRNYAAHLFFREGDHETGLDYITSQVRRHIAETGVRPVVLIDYLQIIAPVDVHFTDKQNLDRIVCALKKLSREEQLTIFAISSFNRENYNLEVSMNAFKESGGIDYSADVLLGLQARGAGRPGFSIDEEKRKDPRELELKILKNRSAAIGSPIPFRYYPAFSCFEEV